MRSDAPSTKKGKKKTRNKSCGPHCGRAHLCTCALKQRISRKLMSEERFGKFGFFIFYFRSAGETRRVRLLHGKRSENFAHGGHIARIFLLPLCAHHHPRPEKRTRGGGGGGALGRANIFKVTRWSGTREERCMEKIVRLDTSAAVD